jgi:hypothetical protein
MSNEISELQAISQSKKALQNVNGENWTVSFMTESDADKFIWTYLMDFGLQYLSPIKYNRNMVALCHQEKLTK